MMSIFNYYWQKWFVDLSLYSTCSADSFEIHPFGIYLYVTLYNSVSLGSDYRNALFVHVYGQQIMSLFLLLFT